VVQERSGRLADLAEIVAGALLLLTGGVIFRALARRVAESPAEARLETAAVIETPPADAAASQHEVVAPDVHLPSPTVWPAVLGLGVALLLFGIATGLVFSALGALLIIAALGGWIREMRHEHA
jgi:hypothetical protein